MIVFTYVKTSTSKLVVSTDTRVANTFKLHLHHGATGVYALRSNPTNITFYECVLKTVDFRAVLSDKKQLFWCSRLKRMLKSVKTTVA